MAITEKMLEDYDNHRKAVAAGVADAMEDLMHESLDSEQSPLSPMEEILTTPAQVKAFLRGQGKKL